MVTRYDVINSRWSSHFWVKMHVLISFNNKCKLVDKMMQSTYVLFYVKHKKVNNARGFYITFNSWWNLRWRPGWQPYLVTSQASRSATTHEIYLVLLRRSKAFNWRQNRFQILPHIENSGEGFHQPHLYHGGGMTFLVRPRINID